MRFLDIYIYNTIIVVLATLANTWEPEFRTIKGLSMLILVALIVAIFVMPFLHWGVVGLADGIYWACDNNRVISCEWDSSD